jgi:CSLREA domain-containing protein
MRTRLGLGATVVTAAAAAVLLAPGAAAAAFRGDCAPACNLVVNSEVDEPDADPGDGACATAAGDCTLRGAVQEANANGEGVVLVPRGNYVLTRHGLDDDASHGDLDVRFMGLITGAGQSRTVIDGDDADRVLDVFAENRISHLAVRGGRATDGPGGGIRSRAYPVDLDYLYVTDNQAVAGAAEGSGNGGGIAGMSDAGIRHTQVNFNRAVNGAGIWWAGAQSGLRANSLIGNHATGDGGGMYLKGYSNHFADTTLSANTAGGHGGGLYFEPPPSLGITLDGFTIASNTAPAGMGGGIWIAGDAPDESAGGQSMGLSIVARNRGGDCSGPGTLESRGGNIDGDGSCGFAEATDLAGVDPLLDDPAYNGGPTRTRAPEPGSPAIDRSECGFFNAADQRGVARPQGTACDSGAFEVGDCCPEYEAPYVPAPPTPPPPAQVGDCGVIRFGTLVDDLLAGTRSKDQVYGRAGDDRIFGGFQADCLYGGPGADFIRGGDGTDLLVGFTGGDHLSGGDDEDVVRGGPGRDRILGGADEDTLHGGPAADYLKGGAGYDTIRGGPGDDLVDATGGDVDTVDCGPGDDRARAKRQDRLTRCERVHFVD